MIYLVFRREHGGDTNNRHCDATKTAIPYRHVNLDHATLSRHATLLRHFITPLYHAEHSKSQLHDGYHCQLYHLSEREEDMMNSTCRQHGCSNRFILPYYAYNPKFYEEQEQRPECHGLVEAIKMWYNILA